MSQKRALEVPKLQMSFASIDAIDKPVLSISMGYPVQDISGGAWTTEIECIWVTKSFKKDLFGLTWLQSLSSAMRFASRRIQTAVEEYRGKLVETGSHKAVIFHGQAFQEVQSAVLDCIEVMRETFIPFPMGSELDDFVSPLSLVDYEKWWNGITNRFGSNPEGSRAEVMAALCRGLNRFDAQDQATSHIHLQRALSEQSPGLIGFESTLGPKSAFRIGRNLIPDDVEALQAGFSPHWVFSSSSANWVLAVGPGSIYVEDQA